MVWTKLMETRLNGDQTHVTRYKLFGELQELWHLLPRKVRSFLLCVKALGNSWQTLAFRIHVDSRTRVPPSVWSRPHPHLLLQLNTDTPRPHVRFSWLAFFSKKLSRHSQIPSISDYRVLIVLIHLFCITSPSLGSAPGVPIPSARPNRLRVQLSAPQLGCSGSQTDIRTITTNRSVIIIVIILFIL
jgi:hypothetical protein